MRFSLSTSEKRTCQTLDTNLEKQKKVLLNKCPTDKNISLFIKFLNSLNFLNPFKFEKKNYRDYLLFRYFIIVNMKTSSKVLLSKNSVYNVFYFLKLCSELY